MIQTICTVQGDNSQVGDTTTCIYSGDFFQVFLFILFGLLFLVVINFIMNFVKSLF